MGSVPSNCDYDLAVYKNNASIHNYLNNNTLSETELVIYAGCYSGETSNVYGNLVDQTLAAGAKNCIGFTHKIGKAESHTWLRAFFRYCRDGYGSDYSINNAISGAISDVFLEHNGFNGTNMYYVGSSPIRTTVIGGNY